MNNKKTINQIRKQMHHMYEHLFTSYHEAGHAIYALLKFIKVDGVSVYENKHRVDGVTAYQSISLSKIEDPILFKYCLLGEICCKYAGLTSEKIFYKTIAGSDKLPMILREGSSSDTLAASNLIIKYNLSEPGIKRYKYKKRLIRNTKSLLKRNWDAVTALAHHLYNKDEIDYNELVTLLTTKTKNKRFWKNHFKKINLIFSSSGMYEDEVRQTIGI